MLSSPQRQVLAVLLVAWLPAGTAGWLIHQAVNGGAPGEVGPWLICVVIATGIGVVVSWALRDRMPVDPAVRWTVLVAVGWAIANAAGWFVGVEVGGPAFGLVTGLGIAAATTEVRISRVALVAASALLAMVAGRLLVDDRLPVVGLVVPAACGLLVLAAMHRMLVRDVPLWPVVGLTCAWGVAFVGVWALTSTFVAPVSFWLSVIAEIVIAVAIGAAALGWCTHEISGEAVWRVVRRWAIASTLGVIGGGAVALLLRTVVVTRPGDGVLAHLDMGTSVGLAVAVAFAVLPTLRHLSRPADARPVVTA